MELLFDTLILLIGTNPLPNFVVADYFIRTVPNLKNIVLIYSERTPHQASTEEFATRIKNLLNEKSSGRKFNFHPVPLSDISVASAIEDDLESRAEKILKSSHSIHLNYTGGTKAMGIHVYRFLLKKFPNRVSFSYLDARTFQIVSDEQGRITDDLRKRIKLESYHILSLHGFERSNTESQKLSIYSGAVEIFKKMIESNRLDEYYRVFNRNFFLKSDGNLIKRVSELEEDYEKFSKYTASGVLLDINRAIPEKFQIFNSDGSLILDRKRISDEAVERTVKFLDGEWLELYLFQILLKHSVANDFRVELDWEIRKRDWPSGNKFQIDLVLIKGYQLIGISCTTSENKKICKNKGFEVFMRTHQIGGEESRAVLVTRLDNPSILQSELQIDTGGKDKIIVLGKNELPERVLLKRILEIIR